MNLIVFLINISGYIDPSILSTFMVAIISAFVAVGMILKTYWYRIKHKISRT